MAKYSREAGLALRLITSKGALITFTRKAAIDPITQTGGSDVTYDAPMVATPLSSAKARYLFGEGGDITKPRLTVNIAVSGAALEPRNGDRFSWGGRTYALASVELLDPAGEGAAIMATGYAEAA